MERVLIAFVLERINPRGIMRPIIDLEIKTETLITIVAFFGVFSLLGWMIFH